MKRTLSIFLLIQSIWIFRAFGDADKSRFIESISRDPLVSKDNLIQVLSKLGNIDQCIQEIKMAAPEEVRQFLFILIKNTPQKDLADLDPIVQLISLVPNPEDQFSLYLQIIKKTHLNDFIREAPNNLIENCRSSLGKFNKSSDEYIYRLIDFTSIIYQFATDKEEESNNRSEIDKLIKSVPDKRRRIEFLEYQIFSDVEVGNLDDCKKHVSMLKEISAENETMASVDSLFEALISIGDFEFIKSILSKSGSEFETIHALKNRSNLYLDFYYSLFGNKYLNNLSDDTDKKRYINLLTRNLSLENASKAVEADTIWPMAHDWHLYYMGKLLLDRRVSRIGVISAINIANQIKSLEIKNEVTIEAAKLLILNYDDEIGYLILKNISNESNDGRIESVNSPKSIAEIWIEVNCLDEAHEYVEKIVNPNERDYQYLLIAEQYIVRWDLEHAKAILLKLKSDSAKGYLLGAMGAIKICQNRLEEGEDIFLRAFKLIKKENTQPNQLIFNFDIALPYLLNYYIHARKDGQFVAILNQHN